MTIKNYLVTFYNQSDLNNEISVEIRSKLEDLSDLWVQVFPNQLAIKTTFTAKEIYSYLLPLSEDIRISIFEFDDYFINESRFNNRLKEYGY